MKKKMIKNLLLVALMVVLCVAVGMTASAGNYEDIWTQGFASENQVMIAFDLAGGTLTDNIEYFNLETMSHETANELSGEFVCGPVNASESTVGMYMILPRLVKGATKWHTLDGWQCLLTNAMHAAGSAYRIPEDAGGTVIRFKAIYHQPFNLIGEELTAGENLTWSFDETTGALEISGEGEMYDFDDYDYICPWGDFRDDIRSITIGEGVTVIGVKAFAGCRYVQFVSLPKSVKEIKTEALSFCVSLKEISFPDELSVIAEGAFQGCFSLESIKIPDTITSIPDKAFGACANLRKIDLGNSVIEIGSMAFQECISLEEINFSESLKTIGERAFYFCLSLNSITLPQGVETIEPGAFMICPYLDKAYILSDSVVISEDVFLQEVTFTDKEKVILLMKEYLMCAYLYEDYETAEEIQKKYESYWIIADDFYYSTTIYCHEDDKVYSAEAYAKVIDVPFERCHFYGYWTYDYENMIRYCCCTFEGCTSRIEEQLETTENGDVDIIAPVDPDTDFTVDVITDYVVIEETVSNNITTDFEIVKAFDINLKNKDGVHVQPDGTVKVKLPLDWSKDGVYKVYRVNDDGTLTDMNAYREGSHMVFDTDHFSIYVIVDESEKTDAPATPDEPQEETKDNFFSKIIDLIKAFFDLIASMFKR